MFACRARRCRSLSSWVNIYITIKVTSWKLMRINNCPLQREKLRGKTVDAHYKHVKKQHKFGLALGHLFKFWVHTPKVF